VIVLHPQLVGTLPAVPTTQETKKKPKINKQKTSKINKTQNEKGKKSKRKNKFPSKLHPTYKN
jgi:hypothetical protein